MTLKIIVKLIEKILGMTDCGDEPRADMYLPDRLLSMALVFFIIGIALIIYACFGFEVWMAVCAFLGIALGSLALLCWKNQTIHVISDEQFTYTTMFGNTRTYYISDIQGLRKNSDSHTLFVANEKVHIESMAIISDRLSERLNTFLTLRSFQESPYLNMSSENLCELNDDQLFSAVWIRTENIVLRQNDVTKGFVALNDEQRIFYAVNALEAEVLNGGLCQFFVNSSRIFAPLVSEYMEIIGATEHKTLYDSFVSKHMIDLKNLSSFDSDTIEDFQAQYDRYPFDEYDDAYGDTEPLQTYLTAFIRNNIHKF